MQPQPEYWSLGVQDTALAPVRICDRLPLAAIDSCGPRLATILQWWESARPTRRWPSWNQVDVGAIRQLADRVTAVQVVSLQMFRYSFIEIIGATEPVSPAEAALEMQTRDELQSVASLGTPRLDHIWIADAADMHGVRRLMLPLSRDCASVNQILICRTDC